MAGATRGVRSRPQRREGARARRSTGTDERVIRVRPRGPRRDGGHGLTVAETARDHLRAIAGGLLVGLPLLMTAEVWAAGALIPPGKLLVLLVTGFLVVIGFNALAGFRHDRTWSELLVDSTQAMGLSALVAAGALAVIGWLDPADGLPTLAGRVAIETIPVAFGASLAATVMSDPEEGDADRGLGAARPPVGALGRLMVGAAGALFFAFNIAPTDETLVLAVNASPVLLLVAVGVGLATGLAIVFYAEFRGGRRPVIGHGPLDGAGGETIAAYATGLLVSLLLIWAFGAADHGGTTFVVAQLVILGIVGAFGAGAARLLIGGPVEPPGTAS